MLIVIHLALIFTEAETAKSLLALQYVSTGPDYMNPRLITIGTPRASSTVQLRAETANGRKHHGCSASPCACIGNKASLERLISLPHRSTSMQSGTIPNRCNNN